MTRRAAEITMAPALHDAEPAAPTGTRSDERPSRRRELSPLAIAICALGVLFLGFALINDRFATASTLDNIAVQSAIPLVVGIGATFVIITGGIDLSTEGVMALAGVCLSLLVANATNGNDLGLLAVPVALAIGAFVGFVNGAVHTWLRLPSFVVTLGTWFIALGIAVPLYKGFPISIEDTSVRRLATGDIVGIPLICVIAAGVLALALVFERRTRLGTWMYAIGGDEQIARLSGVPVTRVKIAVFTLAGLLFGLGGVLAVARLGVGTGDIGSYLFPSLTAVVVGGTALTGGRGSVVNTLVGALIVSVIANGLVLAGVSPSLQSGVQGLLILTVVALAVRRTEGEVVK